MTGTVVTAPTSTSRQRLYTFLAVFERWATTAKNNTVLPPMFLQQLARHVLETKIELRLHDSFHLTMKGRANSSATKQIFCFIAQQQQLKVQYVRKNDNDVHCIDLKARHVQCRNSHWMAGDSHRTEPLAESWLSPSPPTTGKELLSRWFAPQRWLDDGRAVLIRPSDDRATVPVHLCEAAEGALQEGLTLLLIRGALVHISLPDRTVLLFAGMSWREQSAVAEAGSNDDERALPNDLAFIMAENRALQCELVYDDEQAPWLFENGMFKWSDTDHYSYDSGAWV